MRFFGGGKRGQESEKIRHGGMGRADFFAIVLAIGAIAKRRRGKAGAIAGGTWLHVRKGGFLWLSVYPRQRVDAFVAVHQIIAAGKIDLFPKCVACRVALENDQGGFMDAFPLQRLHRVRD